jgi:hypothetical protein
MIKEKYINFEIAKLLKEKGFNKDTYTMSMYDENGEAKDVLLLKAGEEPVLRPTLQMAVDWLLEVHHYYIQVMLDSWAYGSRLGYYGLIIKTDSNFELMLQDVCDKVFYDKPEDVYNDAIKYILENLI